MIVARLGFATLILSVPVCAGCGRTPTVTAQSAEQTSPDGQKEPRPQAIVETSFDDIKFEMEKTEKFERSMLTPKVEELFGRRIRIRGYIYPTMKKSGLKEFVLVRDNLECCFGPGAALFDCIWVHMNEGQTAEYSIRPVAVEGTFRLDEIVMDGKHLAIYRLDGESVE